MNDSSDCPGRFKCHGPASWCNLCGDVDLVCDDPACEVHLRGEERMTWRGKAFVALSEAKATMASAQKEYDAASASVGRYVFGNVVMVARHYKPKLR